MSFLSVSVGAGARAEGYMSVAIGDGAVAVGPYSFCVKETITVPPELTLQQLERVLQGLSLLTAIHSALGNTAQVQALQTATRHLVYHGDELFAIARHEAQRQAQSASSSAAAPDLPQGTPTTESDQSD